MKKIIFILLILSIAKLSFAEIPIYCPKEKIHLYNYQNDEIVIGDDLKARDFIPVYADIPQPTEDDPFACPICEAPLNWYEYQAWEKGQSPPVFYVWAITLLTKNEEGFYWTPYNIE